MRHKFLVLPVKKLLKSVHIYGSYRRIKTGVPFFWNTRYIQSHVTASLQSLINNCWA